MSSMSAPDQRPGALIWLKSAGGAILSAADDGDEDVRQHAQAQADADYAADLADDLTWGRTGGEVFHEQGRICLLRGRRTK